MTTHWEAEAARLSVFTLGAPTLASISDVTGAPATQTMNRPVDKTAIESGNFSNYVVTIVKTPQRVDLLLTPSVQAMQAPTSLPVLGSPEDVVRDLRELSKKWITQPTNAQRLAVGLTVGQSTESPGAALDLILKKVTSFSKGVDPIQDFQIQINRPRASKVDPKVEINRLSKWQVVQAQMIQLAFGGAQPTATGVMSPTSAVDRARAEIDVNTSAKTAEIPGPMIINFIDELAALAVEMVVRGDVP